MFRISALVSDLGFRQINLIPKLSFDYSRIQTCFGMYTFQHPTLAITEGKQKDLVAGFMQNIMQLESSHHTNTRKRKASVAFDDEFDYLYGIVTTGRAWLKALWHVIFFINRSYILTRVFLCLASDWYFLMYTPERIYCSKDDYHIVLNEKIMKDDAKLRRGVKKVMGVIVGLLKDRVEVNDSLDSKRARTKNLLRNDFACGT